MADIEKLREKVAEFRSYRQNEIKFGPIRKWIIAELGCTQVKAGGAHEHFTHEVARGVLNQEGSFQVAVKKSKLIYRPNLKRACDRFEAIIDLLEQRKDNAD